VFYSYVARRQPVFAHLFSSPDDETVCCVNIRRDFFYSSQVLTEFNSLSSLIRFSQAHIFRPASKQTLPGGKSRLRMLLRVETAPFPVQFLIF